MDETIESIVAYAIAAVDLYGGCDKYYILEEVVKRLQAEASCALKMEYFMEETEDE